MKALAGMFLTGGSRDESFPKFSKVIQFSSCSRSFFGLLAPE